MASPRPETGDFKERVRAATDIVELVGQYLKLRRAGSNWQGLCPFHHERTPSFSVSQERQYYYCFGCQRGGDVFSFAMEQEGLDFKEALVFLAKRAGIPVEDALRSGGQRSRHELLNRINESSAEFYHKLLVRAPQAEVAREYLRRRGISEESVARFQLGYAPPAWRLLHEHLGKQGFPPERCEEIGLIRRKSSGPGYYDTFRNRILFPIRSVAGRVLGFGARVLDDSLPKYINSADSPVYTKKRVLYGLDRAWREIRREKRALIVEGYFDVISLHQAGFETAVAASGTAFSEDQARLLQRYADGLCVVTDGDAAGLKATLRAAAVQMQSGGRATVARMPRGEDPDSLLRARGPEPLRELLAGAPGYFEFLRGFVRERGDKPAEKERALRRVLEDLAALPDGDLHLESLLEELAGAFEIELAVLRRALREARRKTPGTHRGREDSAQPDAGAPAGGEDDGGAARREKLVLRGLLSEGPAREALLASVRPEDFGDPLRARIFATLADLGHLPAAAELGELFSDPAAAAVVGELTFLPLPAARGAEWVQAAALRMRLGRLLDLNRDFKGRAAAMELAGETVQAELLAEWRHVGEAIRSVRTEIDQVLAKQKGF